MTKKPDDGLRKIFRSFLTPEGFDMQSIETGGTGAGIPDLNYCRKGVEGWIEFKSTDGWTPHIRPEQVGWISRRTRNGGRVWLAIRRRHEGGPRLGPPVDELYMVAGQHVVELKKYGLTRVPSTLLSVGGPSSWDWRAVANLLCGLCRPPPR